MPRLLNRYPVALLIGALAPLAVAVVLLPWRSHLSNTNVALVLVVAVVAAAVLGYRTAGALAAVSAAVWFDFFYTHPYQHLTINGSADVATAVLLLVVGLAVSQLAARARRLEVVTITDADHLAKIRDAALAAGTGRSPDEAITLVRGQLAGLLGLRACRFERGTLLGHPPQLLPDGSVAVPGRRRWDADRDGLPQGEVELRCYGGGHYVGRFLMTGEPGSRPSLQARLTAVTLAGQIGTALLAADGAVPR